MAGRARRKEYNSVS